MMRGICTTAGVVRYNGTYAFLGNPRLHSSHIRLISSKSKAKVNQPIYPKIKETKPRTSKQSAPNTSRPGMRQATGSPTSARPIYGINGGVTKGRPQKVGNHTPYYVIYPGDTQTMPLEDGGVLGYAVMGSTKTNPDLVTPLVAHPGTPGSRLSYHGLHKFLEARGVPLIVPERPGCGVSTPKKDYTVLKHSRNCRTLLRHLGYKKYRVLGVSGGAPYAYGMAAVAPRDEVIVTGIMAGATPPEGPRDGQLLSNTIFSAKLAYLPFIIHWQVRRKWDAWVRKRFEAGMPPPSVLRTFGKGREALAELENISKPQGYLEDFRAFDRPWGFGMEDLRDTNRIFMYAGTEDRNTPIAGNRWIKERLPQVDMREEGNRDHESIQDFTLELLREMLKTN